MSILKRFFISMLGSLAAIWISMMLIVILVMVMTISAVVSSFSGNNTVNLKDDSILTINIDGVVVERTEGRPDLMTLVNQTPAPASLSDILTAIAAAKEDDRIKGVSLEGGAISAGFATMEAIRNAILDFKESGKWVYAFGDAYSQGAYYIASAADSLFVNPVGVVEFRGIGTGIPFFKGLMDKAGVEMQVVKVGTFKSAVEPYILTGMSEANRLQTKVYLDALWHGVTGAVSESRGVGVDSLNRIADTMLALTPADSLVTLGMVDGLKYENQYRDMLRELTNVKPGKNLRTVNVTEYIMAGAEAPHSKDSKNKIAVYYAFGDITESGESGIASDRVVKDILKLAENDDLDALVMRVNSGGGSAFASEQIWHAFEVFKSKGKKFYVSMGDYAASGGYYISSGADKIYAQSMTITGSIGIFGMIPCVKELVHDKLGVNIDYVTTNANTVGVNIMEPMSPYVRQRMQSMVNQGYELFTKRCAEGRHMSQDSIKAIGEGRVWDATSALKIGLVDEIGGLDAAISALASEMGYRDYQVVAYPDENGSFWEMIAQFTDQMQSARMMNELGDYYPVYREVRRIGDMDVIQARMEPVVIR